MQSLQNWFAGSAPDKEPASGASVLSEWNKYSSSGGGGGGGAGAAPASGNQADRLLASAEEGASTGGCKQTFQLAGDAYYLLVALPVPLPPAGAARARAGPPG